MNDEELDFILRVAKGAPLRLADRGQDRIRQKVRKEGYAEVVMNPRRWVLTAKGWAAFNRYLGG